MKSKATLTLKEIEGDPYRALRITCSWRDGADRVLTFSHNIFPTDGPLGIAQALENMAHGIRSAPSSLAGANIEVN